MPTSPKRPCRFPGCPNLCDKGVYCADHKMYETDHVRGNADARGYDSKWRKARAWYLQQHPLCVECLRKNKIAPATVVDHIVPHRGDKKLFWDMYNWQSLCKDCHDRKTGHGL